MNAVIAYAEGSPCPTLVLDLDQLPTDEERLRPALTAARGWLAEAGAGHIMKIALIAASEHPLFDVDYRFVQALPGDGSQFDFRGSCGHSVLSSVLAADARGLLPRLAPGSRVRVRVLNNGDHIVCEADEVRRESARFTVHFLQPATRQLGELLMTGQATTGGIAPGVPEVSLVSLGNPYVFVDAADLGISSAKELFAGGRRLFDRMSDIRTAAAVHLGWPPEGAFPKVAVVGAFDEGRIAVRAISVPSWHPTLALTGATCLGAAAALTGTIPHRLARASGCAPGGLDIQTPGGITTVTCAVSGSDPTDHLLWVSVGDKSARFLGSVMVEPLTDYIRKEVATCLPLAV